jgi:hypothetical protein
MYIDTKTLPDNFNSEEFIKRWSQSNKALVVMDPTKVINDPITTTTTGNGLWNQLNTTNYPFTDLLEDRVSEVEKSIELIRLENKLLRLKILSMEGKFTPEEVTNIQKMLMSEDTASVNLANTVIENA